jgi:hypothetical protein
MTEQDDTREALDASGYADGDLFPDEGAVRDYFSPSEQRLMFGDDAPDEAMLERMADLVIAERLHMQSNIITPPTETITALAEQGVDELQTILDTLQGQPADSTATTENFSDDEHPRVVLIADPLHADEGDRAAFECGHLTRIDFALTVSEAVGEIEARLAAAHVRQPSNGPEAP